MSRVRWTDQAVEDFPRSGRVVPELQRDDIREIIVGAYRVVYPLEPGVATVLTVFRSSRLLPTGVPELGESGSGEV